LGKKLDNWVEQNKENLARWYDRKNSGSNNLAEENPFTELAAEAKQKLDGATGAVSAEAKKVEQTLNAGNRNTSGANGNGDFCPENSKLCTSGEPVSMVTGEELLELTDFTLKGLIPLTWTRVYRTSNAALRGLGFGWTHPLSETLTLKGKTAVLADAEGRFIELPMPAEGQYSTNDYEGLLLQRLDKTTFRLKAKHKPDRIFQGTHTLRLIALVDAVGNRWDCHYSPAAGHITRMQSSWGTQLLFAHTADGLIESIHSLYPNSEPMLLVRYRYSEERDLIEAEDICGDAEEFRYQNHIIVQRTLRTGYRFYFEWTEFSPRAKCLRQYGDNDNYNYRFEWNDKARVSRSIDSNGGVLEIHYNLRGQVERQIDPLGYVTAFAYNEAGFLTEKTDAAGGVWRYDYDALGNLCRFIDPTGAQFLLEYDHSYRLVSYTDALGYSWRREFNAQGLVSEQIDAEGNKTQYFYNAQGLPELIVDALGRKRHFVWSENGVLLSQRYEDHEPIQYQYNAQQQVAAVEQGGRTTRYEYNIKGDIAAVYYADGTRARLQYNANRQLTAFTDATGRTTRFEYDGLSQIVR
ncbi:MAG TPA: DUF6531 domain-containing protein, partial [Pseudomonadales bacterium]|nr:DUF6531 domain-containing protein [Pseudomonadales bacterium]